MVSERKKEKREKGYLYCDNHILGKTEFFNTFFNLWVKLSKNTKIIFAEKSEVKIIKTKTKICNSYMIIQSF